MRAKCIVGGVWNNDIIPADVSKLVPLAHAHSRRAWIWSPVHGFSYNIISAGGTHEQRRSETQNLK